MCAITLILALATQPQRQSVWTGKADDAWHNPRNWKDQAAPAKDGAALFADSARDCVISEPVEVASIAVHDSFTGRIRVRAKIKTRQEWPPKNLVDKTTVIFENVWRGPKNTADPKRLAWETASNWTLGEAPSADSHARFDARSGDCHINKPVAVLSIETDGYAGTIHQHAEVLVAGGRGRVRINGGTWEQGEHALPPPSTSSTGTCTPGKRKRITEITFPSSTEPSCSRLIGSLPPAPTSSRSKERAKPKSITSSSWASPSETRG